MTVAGPTARQWEINGLQLAGLSWGDPRGRPILALHGWLDNAASFSVLGPLLTEHHIVALDLTGHGHSANRSADAGYHIWDDLPELFGVLDDLGWDRFALIGHSRGAMISTLLASVMPERVERLVLLDAVMPQPVAEAEFSAQLRKSVDSKRLWQRRVNRIYPDIAAAMASREVSLLPPSALQQIVERNLRACEGGYTWTTDLRLRGASAVKMSAGQIAAVLGALTMPTLLLLGDEGFGKRPEIAAQARQHIRQFKIARVSGGHHFHMEPGAAIVAHQITSFLKGK